MGGKEILFTRAKTKKKTGDPPYVDPLCYRPAINVCA